MKARSEEYIVPGLHFLKCALEVFFSFLGKAKYTLLSLSRQASAQLASYYL